MKVYISSTYQDLSEHRATVDRTLRRMGQDVIGMEQYVAEGNKPLDRCLADVRLADLYVIILGWRYGYIPVDQSPPGMLSITELEYGAAESDGKTVLAFLLDPDTPWPTSRVDAMSAEPQRGEAHAGANTWRRSSRLWNHRCPTCRSIGCWPTVLRLRAICKLSTATLLRSSWHGNGSGPACHETRSGDRWPDGEPFRLSFRSVRILN
jgi:Domain of unknown function (DUF4062)